MDRMYRYTRHVYDASRKFYLLGRDTLIADLPLAPGERLLEMGCGTARNLIHIARRHPEVVLYGIDVSDEMLKTAADKVAVAGLADRISLAQGDATAFDAATIFGLDAPLDRIVFSYSLSMIDAWPEALEEALRNLKPGGSIHVVDFGEQEGLPAWFRALLARWLSLFHVRFRPEIKAHAEALAAAGRGRASFQSRFRGYAYVLTFEKAA